MHGNSYLVVAGSTRPIRRSPTIAQWVANLGAELSGAPFQVADLRDLGLGLDDEPGMPAKGEPYVHASTRRWSEMVTGARGLVFVTPQYNWGYPAALKNAIDHLYAEWAHKPALIVTYGGHGGGKCGAQLREVLRGVHVTLADAMPALQLARDRVIADDGEIDCETDFAAHRAELMDALREFVALPTLAAAP